MSLQADILRTEIQKLKQERMTDTVADRLARYWCALQAVSDAPQRTIQVQEVQVASVTPEPIQPVTSGSGVFHDAIRGKDMNAVADVMEQHFEVLSAIAPKHYSAVLAALDKIPRMQ